MLNGDKAIVFNVKVVLFLLNAVPSRKKWLFLQVNYT